jgi:hypothetical protein
VEWRNSKTQYILEAARGLKAAHICCFGGRNDANRPLVDIHAVDRALTDLMGAPESPRQSKPLSQAMSERYIADKQSDNPGKQSSIADKPVTTAITAEAGLRLIRAFDDAKPEGVSGNYHSMTIWALLAGVQDALGIKGDVLGAGVDLATGLFELVMLRPGEKGLFVEIDARDATHVRADSLPEDLRSHARFLKMQSDRGDIDRLLDRRFRWLHLSRRTGFSRWIISSIRKRRPGRWQSTTFSASKGIGRYYLSASTMCISSGLRQRRVTEMLFVVMRKHF